MGEPLRGRRRRRTAALFAGATLCVAGGGAVVAGFAAGLGPLSSESLGAWTKNQPATSPTVLVCDDFEGGDGPLDARAVSSPPSCSGQQWAVQSGGWSVGGGVATSDGTSDAVATVDPGVSNATVEATLGDASTGAAGLVVDHDGSGTYLAARVVAATVVADPATTLELVLVVGGTPIGLDSLPVLIGVAARVSLTRHDAVATVRVDGVTVLTYTLAPAEIATLAAGTRAGLYASSTSTTFDDLMVTSPLV